MQFRIAHPTWKTEWPGWRDTVLVDVCNPIVWHAPPFARVVIPATPSGDMYSLATSHSCIIAVCFFHPSLPCYRTSFKSLGTFRRTCMPEVEGSDGDCWTGALRPEKAARRNGPVEAKGKARKQTNRDERKGLPDTIHGGHRVHWLHEAGRTGVGSRQRVQNRRSTASVLRSRVQREIARPVRGRVRALRQLEYASWSGG
jgi:hypothetical protein